MADQQLQVYYVRGKRGLFLTPIPWAEPAPVVAVPYPSFLEPAQTFHKVDFAATLRELPQLDEYPATPAGDSPYPSYLPPIEFRRSERRSNLLLPELDQYTETPAGFLSGFFPGSALATSLSVSFGTKLQELLPLGAYPAPVTPALYPSYLPPAEFKRAEKRGIVLLPEIDEYPITVPADDTGHYPGSALAASFTVEFFGYRLVEVLELDQYPAIPVVVPAWVTIDKGTSETWTAIDRGADI